MEKKELAEQIYTVENFLSAEECSTYLEWSEQHGYEDAKVQIDGQQVEFKSIRNNKRITFADHGLAEKIWDRFEPFAVKQFGNSEAAGVNELFRFYKYEDGQRFKRHMDGSYVRSGNEASFFTLMIYLNDDFEGGTTRFETVEVTPKKGMALVFYHGIKHSGEPMISGTKYVLRTDVMYKLKK